MGDTTSIGEPMSTPPSRSVDGARLLKSASGRSVYPPSTFGEAGSAPNPVGQPDEPAAPAEPLAPPEPPMGPPLDPAAPAIVPPAPPKPPTPLEPPIPPR